MAHWDFKYLPRRTALDKILLDKAFEIAKNPKHDGHQRRIFSKIYKFFDAKFTLLIDKSCSGDASKSKIMSNQELSEELHKPIIINFEKWKLHSFFIDNI